MSETPEAPEAELIRAFYALQKTNADAIISRDGKKAFMRAPGDAVAVFTGPNFGSMTDQELEKCFDEFFKTHKSKCDRKDNSQ